MISPVHREQPSVEHRGHGDQFANDGFSPHLWDALARFSHGCFSAPSEVWGTSSFVVSCSLWGPRRRSFLRPLNG